MLKKVIALLLITVSSNLLPVILKNGTQVPRAKMTEIYKKLNALYKFEPASICDLDLAVRTKSPLSKIRAYELIAGKKTNSEYFDKAVSLGLCSSNGDIEPDTASVIASAVRVTYKGCIPLWYSLNSPISWQNFKYLKFWLGKDI